MFILDVLTTGCNHQEGFYLKHKFMECPSFKANTNIDK